MSQQADLITKIALLPNAAGVAESVGGFISKTMPKFFNAIKSGVGKAGINASNAAAIKWGLPAAGAAAGAARGYMKADEGSKGQDAITGGLTGAAIGAGAGWGLNKLPNLGSKLVNDFSPAGKRLMDVAKAEPNLKFKDLASRGIDWSSKNLGTQWKPLGVSPNASGPQIKTMWGTSTTPTAYQVGPEKGMAAGAVKTLADTAKAFKDNGVKGVGNVLAQDVKDKMYFSKTVGGSTYKAKRSMLGQTVNPLITSGIGMGVMDAATAKNKNGQPASLGKRLRKGTGSALGWGLASPVMAGKLVYDTSKSIIGGKKPQQDLYT